MFVWCRVVVVFCVCGCCFCWGFFWGALFFVCLVDSLLVILFGGFFC